MKKISVGINGFGRIGRMAMKIMMKDPRFRIAGINDLTDAGTLAHLYKYDSVHGITEGEISCEKDALLVNGQKIPVTAVKDPSGIPWKALGADLVLESTGKFLDTPGASGHLQAGAKKVILSAPAKDNTVKTLVLGVNDNTFFSGDTILSNASCTTNCAAPMIHVLDKQWGVEDGYITTVHSYTGDQRLHDAPHKDLRRARAAAMSIIPTSTGAAKAITRIFPHLEGKLGGCGMRVPVPNGSLTDITCVLTKPVQRAEINAAFKSAAEGYLKGIMQYTEDPIVSVDIIGNPHSVIFDAEFTSVVGNLVKVIGWYDNEAGYSHRLVELIAKAAI
ncbi:MAG: type I glyceraldehyde-3-phosphate dehydrogenase [Bacteroidia bacterium]|nr:type I glyceraldehyde-3-phosphate dehydrogenase [Bacteroidia bacterium]